MKQQFAKICIFRVPALYILLFIFYLGILAPHATGAAPQEATPHQPRHDLDRGGGCVKLQHVAQAKQGLKLLSNSGRC